MMSKMRKCLFFILALQVYGCHQETSKTKIQYMPDMADSPTVKAQEDYLDPPDGSIARSGIIYPEDVAVAEKDFRPQPINDPHERKKADIAGEKLFNIYCTVCHGADGKGMGTLTDAYPKASVPDITRADLAERKDGFYFLKITKGGALMPGYGHAISPHERWYIVRYIRTLQGKH